MKQMRILCVIDDLGSGGAQRQLVSIARGLAMRGHDLQFFTYYPDTYFKPALDDAGIPVHRHEKRGRYAVSPVVALREVVISQRINCIIAFQETPAVYAELATLGHPEVRVLVGEGSTVLGGKASVGRIVKSHMHRLASAVVANSHSHREWLAGRFPFLVGRLHTIWNGVDTDLFRPADGVKTHAGLRLLGIGRITTAKNIPRLIRAVAAARGTGLDLSLDWVGRVDDPVEHARALDALRETRLGLAWRWLGERGDIPDLLRKCDALIAPSIFEGLPNVVCEALSSGVPVLASDVSDNKLLVPDGVRGFHFPPERVEAITAAILRFASTASVDRLRLGENGRSFAMSSLSWSACIDSYERLITEAQSA